MRLSKGWDPVSCAEVGAKVRVFRERGDGNYTDVTETGAGWGGEKYDGVGAVFIDDQRQCTTMTMRKKELTDAANKILPLLSWQYNGPDQGGLVWEGEANSPWNATYKFKCCKNGNDCGDLSNPSPKVTNHDYKFPKMRLSKGWDPVSCTQLGAKVRVFRERGDGNYTDVTETGVGWGGEKYDGVGAVFIDRNG